MTPTRLWNRNFVLIFAISLTGTLPFYILLTSIATYAVASFGAGKAAAGFAASSYILGTLTARIPAGKYLDFIGRRRTVFLAMAAHIVLSLLYAPSHTLFVFIAIRFLHGFAFGMMNTATAAAVQTVIPPHRRAEGTGYFGLATSIAMACGPFLAVTVAAEYSYAWLFYICAAVAVVGSVLALFLTVPETSPSPEQRANVWRLSPGSVIDGEALKTASVMFFAGMAYSVLMTFIDSYTEDIGVPGASRWFFIALAAAMLICRLFVGRLQDTYGAGSVIYPVIVLYAVSLVILAIAVNSWMIILAGVLVGAGFGSLLPSVQAASVAHAAPARYGVILSTFFILLDSGTAIGPLIFGFLEPFLGQRGMFAAAAGVVAIGLVLFWASRRGRGA